GADDPTLSGIAVSLGGLVNGTVTDWNGASTPLNDTGNVSATLATLTRNAGELVSGSPYAITSGTLNALTGTAAGNYTASVSTAGNTLAITPATLTVNLTTDASKTYGTNDPSVNATTPTFTGRVNRSVTDWNNTVTAIDDTTAGAITLSSLTRTAGENVGPYNILSGTAGGTAIGNYTATVNPNAHVLNVTPAALTGTITNQTKVYGADDPTLSGIAVSLGGLVNGTVTDWNGASTPLNDTGNVSATLATLTRNAGETVTAPGPSYAITSGTLNALTGTAAGNYTA